MKKKIFSILLTSILAVTVLAGCGNSADTSTEKSVTITNVSYDPTRELYSAYNERRNINEKLKSQIKDICPILIKGSIEEARKAKEA